MAAIKMQIDSCCDGNNKCGHVLVEYALVYGLEEMAFYINGTSMKEKIKVPNGKLKVDSTYTTFHISFNIVIHQP
jgi:hypothetical protein